MQLCSFSFNLTYLGQTWACELCLESSRSWNRSPSWGIIGLLGWRMFVVKVTTVIAKPSGDECEKGALWAIRQPLTAWEVPCFHLMLSSLCWCSNATKPHPALDSCGRNLSSESKSSPIVRICICIVLKPVSPSVSLSHQEASISLLSFPIWGQTDWKPQSEKTNQSDHMDHGLV